MTVSEQLELAAGRVTDAISAKYLYFSNPQKAEIKRLVMAQFEPLVVTQPALNFQTVEDVAKSSAQCTQMLALLCQRKSVGAANYELAEIALKYTSRIDDLRKEGYRISCKRDSGRVWRYVLSPEHW